MSKELTPQQRSRAEKQMVDSYLDSIALNNTAKQVADIMLLVDNPFLDRKSNDAVSLIFHRFHKHTSTHPALPIFAFFSMLSAWCVENKATCKIPLTKKPTELDTWVLLLAETGAKKTLSVDTITDLLPKDMDTHDPIIAPNFIQPASNASFVEQIAELPNHRGFWKQDEGAQFIKQIDQTTGPLAGINQSMLITKDHGSLDRATKKDGKTKIKGPVLTVLMINTIDSMIRAMSEESMENGIFRRFTTAWAGREGYTPKNGFENSGLMDFRLIQDNAIEGALLKIFTQDIGEASFTFTHECIGLYNTTRKVFWVRQYEKFMGEKLMAYFDTYMMESWRYAVFHHLIHQKEGKAVDAYSLQWGLKVSMYLLNSLQSFVARKAAGRQAEVPFIKSKIEKVRDFIKENETKPDFGVRAVCRKFTMTKEDLFGILSALKIHEPKFKTSLHADLAKHLAKESK